MTIRGIILDIDGTVVLANKVLDGAPEALAFLREFGYRIVFCTQQNEFSDRVISERLHSAGLPVSEQEIVSAGSVSVDVLSKKYCGSPIYVVGSESLRDRMTRAGMKVLPDQQGETADVVLVATDSDINLTRLSAAAEAVRRGADFYVTNLDRGEPMEDRIIPGPGSLALAIGYTAGRRPTVLGKPSQTMVTAVQERLNLPASAIVVIGDQPAQDVRLGRMLGAVTVLLLSGVTSAGALERTSSSYRPDAVLASIRDFPAWLEAFNMTISNTGPASRSTGT
ncbi:MAG: HAD-IIA family hydrolase [Actinomycetota bacterium]|nr:HAD-IIA family hydrolase [Actinomycetota bacterium]